MSDAPDLSWSIVSASVRGASHIRKDLPNQDATMHRVLDAPPGATVAAVADGHGGTRYVRSDRGSAFAVEKACDVTAAFLAENNGLRGPSLVDEARDALVPAIVGAWREAVQADLAREPLEPDELERTGPLTGDGVFLAYGATLLVSVVWADAALLLQIGDGDLVAVSSSGAVTTPIPPDPRLVAGETTSLGLPDAVDSFRIAELVVAGDDALELLMLCTDGYGNSFADPEWRTDVGQDLLQRANDGPLAALGKALPAWLAESATAGGDDVTVALLHRDGPAPPAPTSDAEGAPATIEQRAVASVPPPPPPPIPSAGSSAASAAASTTRPAPGASSRKPLFGALALGVVALLAVAGFVGLRSRDQGGTTLSAAEESTTTTELSANPSLAEPDASAPASTATPIGGPVSLIDTGKATVQFDSSDAAATARYQPSTNTPTTRVDVADRIWAIASGRLVVSDPDGTNAKRPLTNFTPAGLLVVGDRVWLATSDGTRLTDCAALTETCDSPSITVRKA